ncbi:uncharacterized protein LOC123500494 [Portunus trituberculatus]|uniref:uncharacterized protein LOC123500494 n=1 Tax=Portunus trituberculatus TaxID=210409 RepID=UPI001E1CCF7E|nr:uncharacterized protein LOC123500494 [Portunus trituberculatus]
MRQVQQWAQRRWQEDLKTKLSGRSVGSKTWWTTLKQQQGLTSDDDVPPLHKSDGTVATKNKDKAEVLASFFSNKMSVPDPERPPPFVPALTNAKLSTITITIEEVRQRLSQVDTNKALGPDNISPHILKHCASQLATPLTAIFQHCITTGVWPTLWKGARVVAIHKRARGLIPRTIDLSPFSQFLGKDTFIIALDIAGAFDRVWHHGLITKLNSLGIHGHLLLLLQDYLRGRYLRVVMNGQTSDQHPISASVPQGSVLGPLLWNAFFNDLLQLIPEAHAYADDCTLTFPCDSGDHCATVAHINQVLQTIVSWGHRWQVELAPDKTQVMLVSDDTPLTHPPSYLMEGRYPCRLPSPYLLKSAPYGVCPLTWLSCPSYLSLLDKIQHRAQRLIRLKAPPDQPSPTMQPLQQRRDVAGLCVIYKTHKQGAPHLTALRQPWAQPHGHTTRAATSRVHQLVVPFARTETFLRSFLPRYTRMWNHLVMQTQLHYTTSLHTFKSAANAWIKQP